MVESEVNYSYEANGNMVAMTHRNMITGFLLSDATLQFSPITVPGTPDHQNDKVPCENLSSGNEITVSPATYTKGNKEQDEGTDDELEDLFLYYKAFSKHPPDIDESNAESAARHEAIDDEYRLLQQQKMNQQNEPKYDEAPTSHAFSLHSTRIQLNVPVYVWFLVSNHRAHEPVTQHSKDHTQQRARHHDTKRPLTLDQPRQALETPDHRPNL